MAAPPPPLTPRVIEALRESGYKQSYLADRLGMARPTLSDRMRGRTRFTADELPAIAHVLGMTVAELLEED